jgi:hypothetical protein
MKYVFEPHGQNSFIITNENAVSAIGRVYLRDGRYHVSRDVNDEDEEVEVAAVKTLDKALGAFVVYHESHPARWEPTNDHGLVITGPAARRATRYTKTTDFAWLVVRQEAFGLWAAYRDEHQLMQDGKPALFGTLQEAQRVADLHDRDGFPHQAKIDDGYTWPVDPHVKACLVERGRWANPVGDRGTITA